MSATANITATSCKYKSIVDQLQGEPVQATIGADEAIITSSDVLLLENQDGGDRGREDFAAQRPRCDSPLDLRLAIGETLGGLDTSD